MIDPMMVLQGYSSRTNTDNNVNKLYIVIYVTALTKMKEVRVFC